MCGIILETDFRQSEADALITAADLNMSVLALSLRLLVDLKTYW